MRQIIITLILLFIKLSFGQTFSKCKVYQFKNNDSINETLVLTETFNKSGKLIYEINSGYIPVLDFKPSEASIFYYYKDTLLIQKIKGEPHEDSIKWIYTYNDKNQLIKEEIFNFTNDTTNKQFVYDINSYAEYSNKEKIWKKKIERIYKYDLKGNLIEELSPKEKLKIIYEYNKKQRLKKEKNYRVRDSTLEDIEKYHYTKAGYKIKHIILRTKYTPRFKQSITEVKTDKNNGIEEMIFIHKHNKENPKDLNYSYYNGKSLIKEIDISQHRTDLNGKSIITCDSTTHIYVYEK